MWLWEKITQTIIKKTKIPIRGFFLNYRQYLFYMRIIITENQMQKISNLLFDKIFKNSFDVSDIIDDVYEDKLTLYSPNLGQMILYVSKDGNIGLSTEISRYFIDVVGEFNTSEFFGWFDEWFRSRYNNFDIYFSGFDNLGLSTRKIDYLMSVDDENYFGR